jgi:outer membrane lipoprotein-sorting protein
MLRSSAVFLALLVAVMATNLAEPGPGPSAEEILEEMVVTYAGLDSYRDAIGVNVIAEGDAAPARRLLVDTAFERPGLFRFRLHEIGDAAGDDHRLIYVVWSDGQGVRSWSAANGWVREFSSIEHALGGPTGISYQTATRIPALLMPEMLWGSGMRHLKDAVLLGEESIDHHDCFKLEATTGGSDRRLTLWLDKRSFLLRQIYDARRRDDGSIIQMTAIYAPQGNPEVFANEFEFEPPF